jgi:hypothetical protein
MKLLNGENVSFRPVGNSMLPKIKSRDLVEVEPVQGYTEVKVNDIVLCLVNGNELVHLVSAVDSKGRYQISNSKGHVNGWIPKSKIFGRVVSVEGVSYAA